MNFPTLENKRARFQELVNMLATPEQCEQAFEALKKAGADLGMLGVVSKRYAELSGVATNGN